MTEKGLRPVPVCSIRGEESRRSGEKCASLSGKKREKGVPWVGRGESFRSLGGGLRSTKSSLPGEGEEAFLREGLFRREKTKPPMGRFEKKDLSSLVGKGRFLFPCETKKKPHL